MSLNTIKLPPRRFAVASLGEAWTVADHDGRPVTPPLTYADAADMRWALNLAAAGGQRALAIALNAAADFDPELSD